MERYPVFDRKPKKDNSGYIIVMIIIIIVAIALGIVVYAIYRPTSETALAQCLPGVCAVNLGSGVKRCPASNSASVTYDIVFEACTSGNYCQSTKAPCAVKIGGTLDCNGVCGPGNDQCNCDPHPT